MKTNIGSYRLLRDYRRDIVQQIRFIDANPLDCLDSPVSAALLRLSYLSSDKPEKQAIAELAEHVQTLSDLVRSPSKLLPQAYLHRILQEGKEIERLLDPSLLYEVLGCLQSVGEINDGDVLAPGFKEWCREVSMKLHRVLTKLIGEVPWVRLRRNR